MADKARARSDEDEGQRIDRELIELLNEVRVAMPGVQVLFGFLLTVPFQQRFADITSFQRTIYLATLLLAAGATAFFIAPTAYHRITFREGQKPHLIKLATVQTLIALALLALAMTGAVLLITDLILETRSVAVITALLAGLYLWLWFGAPILRRVRGERAW